jgi:predicted transcriptional regulator
MAQDEYFLQNSQKVYKYILQHPGLHLRKISRDLEIHLSTLRYTLDYLEKKEVISSRKEKNLKIYFVQNILGSSDKRVTSLLQQKRFRNIILQILLEHGTTHKKIIDALTIKPSTLSKYLDILEENDVIAVQRNGRNKNYYLKDEKQVIELLLKYRKSFWDTFVDNVLEVYFER